MNTLALLLWALAVLQPQLVPSHWFELRPEQRTISGNYSADVYGPVDTRMPGQLCAGSPCIWGHADSAIMPLTFRTPAGQRVRILSLRGDVIAWVKTLPGDPVTPLESAAGILGGFQTTSSGATADCDYCANGCPLYVQGAVSEKQPSMRIPFDYDNVGQLLDADNILNVKVAEFLNTTGKPIHMELTYTIQYRFE